MTAPMKKIESISPEVMAELQSIHEQISDYKSKIKELSEHADSLVPKHDLEECREFGCIHTCHKKSFCWYYECCVRSKWAHGATRDYYEQKKVAFKPPVDYPTLGWKTAVYVNANWNNKWHTKKVIKETDKTLILDDKTLLLKSTISMIEDCTFIKDRREYTYVCADDPEALEMQVTLWNVAQKEWREQNSARLADMHIWD